MSSPLGLALLVACISACVIDVTPNDQGNDAGDVAPSSGSYGIEFDASLPMGSWSNVTANLANMDSECGNMTSVTAKPDEDLLIAGIALHGLWASRNGGGMWTQLGTGAGSATIDNRPTDIEFDPMDSNRWWEVGSYGSLGGVYRTDDDGTTFTQLGTIHHDDFVSVDFTDPERKLLLVGPHEMPQSLLRSTDGGTTWTNIGAGLPSGMQCPNPMIVDANTYLVGCNKIPGGIYRTSDAGSTWTNVTMSGGNDQPLRATSDGSIYWASLDGTLTRSTDGGQSWTNVIGGGVLSSVHPIELPNGRLATLGQNRVVVSADHGAHWTAVSPQLQPTDGNGWVGVAYSSQQKAFFAWHFSCANGPIPVPADGIMRYDFDYRLF